MQRSRHQRHRDKLVHELNLIPVTVHLHTSHQDSTATVFCTSALEYKALKDAVVKGTAAVGQFYAFAPGMVISARPSDPNAPGLKHVHLPATTLTLADRGEVDRYADGEEE